MPKTALKFTKLHLRRK